MNKQVFHLNSLLTLLQLVLIYYQLEVVFQSTIVLLQFI